MTSTVLELFNSKHRHPFQMRPAALILVNTPPPPSAGIDDVSQVDAETIKNIPVDLWREDIDGVKSECNKDRTNKS